LMRLLLDTQILLWWLVDDPRLGPDTRELMASTACLVSVASIWEVAIKHRLGKLPVNPAEFRDQSLAAGASLLPVLDGHVIETANLPLVHGDPFDRLLIAQARLEGLMAVSSDGQWGQYEVLLHHA
jgi:PIN domain nuclease of toxin-antitoxin system